MAKKKLARFLEIGTFPNVFQPDYLEIKNRDFFLKGKWAKEYFKNNNPIVLELGCGKGEYTVALAQRYPAMNYIGVDIKGARIWKGAKFALENKLNNIAFIRTRIQALSSFFARNEISKIWLTFPDPQMRRKKWEKKRLLAPAFLNIYNQILKSRAYIHLKTDSLELFNYTLEVLDNNAYFKVIIFTDDLYNSGFVDEILSIKTFYEEQFLAQGKTIKYIKFQKLG